MDIVNIEKKLIYNKEINSDELMTILDYIVSSVREIVNDETFNYKCDFAQGLISDYLNNICVVNHPCSTNHSIHMNAIGHSFVVAVFNNKNYLIDPAFVQFYYNDNKYNDMIVNGIRVKSKSPFHYGVNINKDVINNLINKGYMELTDYNAFVYANSFYKTITGSDYDNQSFIEGDTFIKRVLEENDKLHFYGDDSIEVKSSGLKK